jgi:hypothetical protein
VSDFFSRLLDRCTGAAAVARPVVPPLFGPSPAPVAESDEAVAPVATPVTESFAAAREISIVRPPAQPVAEPLRPRAEPSASYAYPAEAAQPPAPGFGFREPPHHWKDASVPLEERAQDRVAGRVVEAPVATRRPIRQTSRIDVLRPAAAVLPTPARSTEAPNAESLVSRPVVVVTIGRIEVKAAQPAAPTPPPTPRKPAAVSLEEYLQPHRRKP